MTVGFRPTPDDRRIIETHRLEGESTADVLRRGLRSLERRAWEEQAREDMARLRNEDLSKVPSDWDYGADGDIRAVASDWVIAPRDRGRE
ncbi:hypothetical protein J4H86_14535 [Spiractinospora alimapuensis]|uniref:hypothetical protein n=1 Tax=Spiractinospora alimapuensis TaxID=2820884 RepID=UPI001F2BC1F0|nr:hypothetical protein [Spiractinospora alimapuensis]QVQ50173.1 hypothetical protein J4H86_14535 [Spiractinospora alimapuensis]